MGHLTQISSFIAVFLLSMVLWGCSDGLQMADPHFKPNNTVKAFLPKNSPVLVIDEAHHNFLTSSGRYKPFADVLQSAGYTIKANTRRISRDRLSKVDVLVIANALDRNRTDWLPPYGDAFESEEVVAINQWVSDGGALFLIADHTPFPQVVNNLAVSFGVEFSNGHVAEYSFKKDDASLASHVITGLTQSSTHNSMPSVFTDISGTSITHVKTFGGSAFKPPQLAVSLLTFKGGAISQEPEIPFQVTPNTPQVSLEGWSQGAVMEYGKGRLAVFAEGMMFSSQLDAKTQNVYGMRSVGAEHNERFLLNLMSWLVREM